MKFNKFDITKVFCKSVDSGKATRLIKSRRNCSLAHCLSCTHVLKAATDCQSALYKASEYKSNIGKARDAAPPLVESESIESSLIA